MCALIYLFKKKKKREIYLASRGFSVSEHMSKSWDNVDGESNQESTHGGVNGTKEREDDGQEPNWNDDR